MSNTIENIDDLLGKYLAGEATVEECARAEQWIAESPGNREYFNQLKTIFDKAALVPQDLQFDADAAWQKVRGNLKQARVIPIQRRSYSMWYQVAAAVLVLFVVALYLITKPSADGPVLAQEIVAEKSSVSDTLPGGSDVFLNKKTRLAYAYDAKTRTHEVSLKGEAYFNVKRSKREDFVIDAGGVFIRDIGTSFNVKAYPGEDVVEVLVEDGEIVFFTAQNPGIHLRAGGKGVYNRKTGAFNIEAPDPNIVAYKTRFFVFERADLGSVVDQLNNVYPRQIVLAEGLRNCRLTVSFKNEPVEEIAEVIAETLGLTVRMESEKIYLEGEGCE